MPLFYGKMRTLLIAHHRSYLRRVLQLALERCGYQVAQAADSASAMSQVSEHPPDALIIDAEFEDGCARNLCEAVTKAQRDAMPFICVLSERVDARPTSWWLELPGTIVAEMPLSARALSAKIEHHFEGSPDDS